MTMASVSSYRLPAAIRMAAFEISRKGGMARLACRLAIVLTACALLSGCDKCTGDLQDIRLPFAPHACTR
jgi:hypothetical protein